MFVRDYCKFDGLDRRGIVRAGFVEEFIIRGARLIIVNRRHVRGGLRTYATGRVERAGHIRDLLAAGLGIVLGWVGSNAVSFCVLVLCSRLVGLLPRRVGMAVKFFVQL